MSRTVFCWQTSFVGFEEMFTLEWYHSWIPPVGQDVECKASWPFVVVGHGVETSPQEIWVYLECAKKTLTLDEAVKLSDELLSLGWRQSEDGR